MTGEHTNERSWGMTDEITESFRWFDEGKQPSCYMRGPNKWKALVMRKLAQCVVPGLPDKLKERYGAELLFFAVVSTFSLKGGSRPDTFDIEFSVPRPVGHFVNIAVNSIMVTESEV